MNNIASASLDIPEIFPGNNIIGMSILFLISTMMSSIFLSVTPVLPPISMASVPWSYSNVAYFTTSFLLVFSGSISVK